MGIHLSTTPRTISTLYSFRACSVTGFAILCASNVSALTPRCSASNSRSSARFRALDRADTSVDSAEVRAITSVDLDLGALLDEQRDSDLGARLERRRLGAAGGTVPLQTRLGVGDLQGHGSRKLDVQRGAVVRGDHGVLVLQHELGGIADHVRGDVDLVEGIAVHEDEVVAVLVQVLHGPFVDVGRVDLGPRVEGLLNHLAGQDRLEIGPHEGRTLTGLDMLELHDGPELVADVEDHAVLEVVGRSQERRLFRMTGGWLACAADSVNTAAPVEQHAGSGSS